MVNRPAHYYPLSLPGTPAIPWAVATSWRPRSPRPYRHLHRVRWLRDRRHQEKGGAGPLQPLPGQRQKEDAMPSASGLTPTLLHQRSKASPRPSANLEGHGVKREEELSPKTGDGEDQR